MTSNSVQPIDSGLAYRFSIYDLLRRLFLWEVPLELFIDLVKAAKGGSDGDCFYSARQPEAVLQDYLKGLPEEKLVEIHREAHIEYTRLFIGPRHLPAPPYESVYRSPEHLMMRDETIDVRRTYANNGFQVRRINQEPDDMVGIELEFMSAMSNMSVDAERERNYGRLGQLIAAQREFCELHLLKWVPPFCDDVIANSQHEFWRSVAVFTRTFLEADAAELSTLSDTVKELTGGTISGSSAQ